MAVQKIILKISDSDFMTLAKIENEENISSERMEKALKVLELIENGTFEQIFLNKFLEGIKCNKDLTDFIQTATTSGSDVHV